MKKTMFIFAIAALLTACDKADQATTQKTITSQQLTDNSMKEMPGLRAELAAAQEKLKSGAAASATPQTQSWNKVFKQ